MGLFLQVSVESEESVFCVGVAHKPLFHGRSGSPAFWALEAHTGQPNIIFSLKTFYICMYIRSLASFWRCYGGSVHSEGEG